MIELDNIGYWIQQTIQTPGVCAGDGVQQEMGRICSQNGLLADMLQVPLMHDVRLT